MLVQPQSSVIVAHTPTSSPTYPSAESRNSDIPKAGFGFSGTMTAVVVSEAVGDFGYADMALRAALADGHRFE